MAARLKQGGHESFLNKLLLLREQEVLNLSKKLHNQAAIDSDVSSGKEVLCLLLFSVHLDLHVVFFFLFF